MTFQPGQSGNPLGRPKRPGDPRSADMQEFCKNNRDNIRKVGKIAFERAITNRDPWAIKLCMEYFYPKPGSFVSVTREETKAVSVGFVHSLPYEDQQTFLRLWMRARKSGVQVANARPDQGIDEASVTDDGKE